MNHNPNLCRKTLAWAFSAGLMMSLSPLVVNAQSVLGTLPLNRPLDFSVPGSPETVATAPTLVADPTPKPRTVRLPNGKLYTLPVKTTYADTRPELAVRNRKTNGVPSQLSDLAPNLQQGSALGDEGVFAGTDSVSPFGSKGEPIAIAFRSGLFTPPTGERLQPALRQLAASSVGMAQARSQSVAPFVHALVLFNGRPDEATLAALKNLGVTTTRYFPYAARLAKLPLASLNAAANLPGVRWIGQPTSQQKLAPEIVQAMQATPMMARLAPGQSAPTYDIFVSLYESDGDGSFGAALKNAGANVALYDDGLAVYAVHGASATLINDLLDADATLYVETIPEGHTMDTQSMSAINADYFWGVSDPTPAAATVVRIGLVDSGSYVYHNDFTNIIGGSYGYSLVSGENWYDDLNSHGTHVSGTIFGEGRAQARYRGIAQGFHSHGVPTTDPDLLVAQVFDKTGNGSGSVILQGFQAMNGEFINSKRQVFNYSGGTTSGNLNLTGTDVTSQKIDQVFGNNVLACIAAGNSGSGSSTIASPGVAKGAFTVGAIYDDFSGSVDTVTGYSSRGPTGDGRVKPDIVAPGSYIMSTKSRTYSSYLEDQGTSMATPHVAGVAAGMIGAYGMPAWATKATMIANAIDLGYSSNDQGRGKLDAMLSHYNVNGFWGTNWFTNGATGSVNYIDITLSQYTPLLQVVMTYPDPAPASGASIALVNDVDLGVQAGTLTTDFSVNWVSQSSRDTVESLRLTGLAAGTYRIKVKSYSVSGSQAVAVCYHATYGSITPNVSDSLSTPYAVQPGTTFTAAASAYCGSYVASSVLGSINLGSGLTNNTMTYYRHSPSGGFEGFNFPDSAIASGDSYSQYAMNMGDIGAGYTRYIYWNLKAPSYDSTQLVKFSTSSKNGGSASAYHYVIVDGTAPVWDSAGAISLNWTNALHCDVKLNVQDVLAGLDVSTALFRYSNDGGATWSSFINVPCTGGSGTTATQTITATDVAFNHNDPALNLAQFYIVDRAGNYTYSPAYAVSSPVEVYGYAELQSCVNPGQPIDLIFRPTDGSGDISYSVTMASGGGDYGFYDVTGLPAGKTYQIWTKGDRWLAAYGASDTHDVLSNYTGSTYLPGGDVDNNNVVNVNDLFALLSAFNTAEGDGSGLYESQPTADLNCDGKIDVTDLFILLDNFNIAGAP